MSGSKPFSLTVAEWKTQGMIALFAVIAALAAYATGTLLPTLQSHSLNEWGNLIVAIATAITPIIVAFVSKWAPDTRVAKMLLLAALLSLGCGSLVLAGEASATPVADFFGHVTVTQWIAVGAAVVLGFVNKQSIGQIIRKVADVLDPPTPAVVNGPVVNGPTPVVVTPVIGNELATLLINLISQFKKAGNAEAETHAKALLDATLKA